MKNFLLGFAAGALGAYVAIKLADEDTRKEWCTKAQQVSDRAKEEIDYGLTVGKSKALRAGVVARTEVRKGKEKINQVAGDLAGKLSAELADFEKKAKAKA